jgi:hypothetical protein
VSAFMVSTETIHEVTRVLLEGGKSLGRPYEHEPYESRVEVGTELGRKLIQMNARAMGARYNEEPEVTEALASYRYREHVRLPTRKDLCQTVKALDCYLYQCTEWDVAGERLYKQVEELRDCLVRHIVHELPEYETADWDMRPQKAPGLIRLV